MDWAKHAAKAILPLSEEKQNLALAFREWRYTGCVNDLEIANETCQLCGHPEIRYQFEIRNSHNNNSLLIGSECVKRFDISAVDEKGNVLGRAETHTKIARDRHNLIHDAREQRMMLSLINLVRVERKFNIENFITYYKEERGAFTPKQLLLLLGRLSEHRVKHNKRDFKMIIRRDREKEQLACMDDGGIDLLWGCMTSGQQKWFNERFPQRREAREARFQDLIAKMQNAKGWR